MKTFKSKNSLYNLQYMSSLIKYENNIVYVKSSISEEHNKYVSSIILLNTETNEERILVENDYQNTFPVMYQQKLLFLSNLKGSKQVFEYNLQNDEISQVTFAEYDIEYIDVIGDSALAFVTKLPQEITKEFTWNDFPSPTPNNEPKFYRIDNMKYQADGVGFTDQSLDTFLCIQNLENHSVEIISDISRGYGMRRYFSTSSDGSIIYFEKKLVPHDNYNSDSGIYSYNRQTLQLKHITHAFKTGIFTEPSVSPDHKYMAMIGNELPYETPNQLNLYLYSFERDEIVNVSKLRGYDLQFSDNSVSDLYQNITAPLIQWFPTSKKFYVMASEYGNVNLYSVDLNGNINQVSSGNGVVKEYTVTDNDSIFAMISTPSNPVALKYYENLEWKTIPTSVSDHYAEFAYGNYQEIEYEAEDGGIIHGYLCLPFDYQRDKKYPLILNIHGGPYTMHSWNFFHEVQLMLSNHYMVLLINPRGSFGYGQEHTYGVYERYGKEDYTDLMTAVDKVIENYSFIDEERLFVTGGSYGGFMTNWIITQTNRFKAAVSQRSMSNFVSMFGTSDIGYFFYKDETGYDISQPDKLWEASPLAYAENVTTPLLLIHAFNDLRCPFEQAQQFYIALKHFKKEAEMLVFPNANHELSRTGLPSYRVARVEAIIDWFGRYMT